MTAAARIRILRGGAERAIDVAGGEITIGRAPGQTLRIVEDEIAPAHAALRLDGAWRIEARGGAVHVGAARLGPGQGAPIAAGAEVRIGGFTLRVEPPPTGAPAAGPARTASLARELVRDLLGGEDGGGPMLAIVDGPSAGQSLPVPPAPSRLVIGRGEEADVVVLDPDLSRRHAAFERDDDGVRVVDLGSKNGTAVDGAPVGEGGRRLASGDVVALGATRIRFHDPAEEYLRALEAPPAVGPASESAGAPPGAPEVADPGGEPSLWPVVVAGAIAIGALVALVWLLV